MSTQRFQNKYRIPSARANWCKYDEGLYFITICTQDKIQYFGKITNKTMFLSDLGNYVDVQIQNIELHYPYAKILNSVIMPNHLHFVFDIAHNTINKNCQKNPELEIMGVVDSRDGARSVSKRMQEISHQKKALAVVIGGLKSAITRHANLNQTAFKWQTRYHDRIIRDYNEFLRISDYINTNIEKWEQDKFYKLDLF